jgi:hypothetical protein
MSDTDPKLALNNAVLEWKQKHHIQETDPILANLEILEIYFNYRYGIGPVMKSPPSYTEFRDALEQHERLIKQLGKYAGDVIQEVRTIPKLREGVAHGTTTAIVIAALASLMAGVLIGKFLI